MSNISVYKPKVDIPMEWKEFLQDVSAQGKSAYEDYFYEKELWNKIADEPTPLNRITEREGFKGKMLEYIAEDYTLEELNRLFPGWWTDDMKRSNYQEIAAFRSVMVEGYLMIPYPTPSGTKVRKLWAIAGNNVEFLQGTKDPVDITNNFKGARTEWIRIAGKWLGIGLDIYHQKITPDLRSGFEDICRSLGGLVDFEDEYLQDYVKKLKEIAGTLETGHGFRMMLQGEANPNQIKQFMNAIKTMNPKTNVPVLPIAKQSDLWKHFLKFNNRSEAATEQLDTWLTGLVTKMKDIKTKLQGD